MDQIVTEEVSARREWSVMKLPKGGEYLSDFVIFNFSFFKSIQNRWNSPAIM